MSLSTFRASRAPRTYVQATCVQYRLVIRDVNTLQILQLYTCLDQVVQMEWSSDSLFILCAMYKRGLVQVCTDQPHALPHPPHSSLLKLEPGSVRVHPKTLVLTFEVLLCSPIKKEQV